MASHPPIQSSHTGGSNTGSQFSSRNPYRPTSPDPYYTPQQSPNPTGPSTFNDFNNNNSSSTTQPQAATMSQPDSDAAQQAGPRPPLPAKPAAYQAQPVQDSEAAPPLPARPEAEHQEPQEGPASDLPERPSPQSTGQNQETHPGFTAPFQTGSNPTPPRRHLTSTNIASTTIPYARNPTRVTSYLLPLPAPTSVHRKGKGTALNVPQRYLLYTPAAAHLLKPDPATDGKERKRHRLKRVAQQELRKAKTYEGRTVSLKGLHSKALRGMDWAIAGIKSADITFFARVPRKVKDKAAAEAGAVVEELVLMHPPLPAAQRQEEGEEEEVHAEFRAQVGRTQRKARKHSAISVGLFLPALVVDLLLVIIWPFGGLAEIDGVWAYASLSAWLTARSVQKRLDANAMVTVGEAERETLGREVCREEGRSEDGEERILRPGEDAEERRLSRQVHFHEELGANDEKANVKVNGKKTLTVSFVPDEAMRTMESYFQEILHKRNPKAFASPGVPPTKTDVLASIGWLPDRRGRAPDSQNDAHWDDENVSICQFLLFECQCGDLQLTFCASVANPSSQRGSGQGLHEGRERVGQVVQTVCKVPRACNEGEGPQQVV